MRHVSLTSMTPPDACAESSSFLVGSRNGVVIGARPDNNSTCALFVSGRFIEFSIPLAAWPRLWKFPLPCRPE
jgi:hypothetical protein